MSSPLNRRLFLGAGALTVATLTLPGCSAEAKPLRVAWYGTDPLNKAMKAVLERWKSGTGVEYAVENAGFADFWDKLATQTSGGNAPDLMRMSMSYFSDYASRGTLADLSGAQLDTSALDPGVAGSGKVGEKVFGIGQSSITFALFVNDAAVTGAGLEVPDGGWTWDSYAEFAKDYAAAVDGSYGTPDASDDFQLFEVYARQHGTDLFNDAGDALAVSADTVRSWYEYWAALRAAKAAPPAEVSREASSIEKSLVAKGKAPAQFGWVQRVSFYQPFVKTPLSVQPVPQQREGDLSGQFVKALDLWSVSAETEHLDEAVKLLNFLLTDDGAIAELGILLGVPPTQHARDLIKKKADSAGARAIAFVEQLGAEAGPAPAPWPRGYGELLDGFGRIAEDIGFGRSDPAAGTAEFLELSRALAR